MGDLWFALIKANLSIDQVGLAYWKTFMYPWYALEPDEFEWAAGVAHFGDESFASFFADGGDADESCGNLDVFCGRVDIPYQVYFGFIDMAIGEMFEEVFPGEKAEFFF